MIWHQSNIRNHNQWVTWYNETQPTFRILTDEIYVYIIDVFVEKAHWTNTIDVEVATKSENRCITNNISVRGLFCLMAPIYILQTYMKQKIEKYIYQCKFLLDTRQSSNDFCTRTHYILMKRHTDTITSTISLLAISEICHMINLLFLIPNDTILGWYYL